jgi:solute carrier family 10 (sodium/bile acid cotransporter), member 7
MPCIIIVLAGLALRTDEFVSAFQKLYFNAFVQIFNFGFVSCVVFGFSRLMIEAGAISQVLGDGMAICGSLPITVNMCVVLTKAAGGGKFQRPIFDDDMMTVITVTTTHLTCCVYLIDEALSIFNTAFSNMIGIFLSPILILGYVGVSGNVPIGTTFYQLSIRVLLPIVVGQVLQKMSRTVAAFVKRFKPYFLRGQEYSLVFILYTTFCKTFAAKQHIKIEQILFMILFQCILLGFVTVVAWFSLRALFRDEPKMRVMGLFGCTQKTIAVGVPLITSIYAKNPNLGLYLLPLLIWYPMQLIIGSLLVPRLRNFIASENERLGIVDKDAVPAESTFLESDEEQPSEHAAEGFVGEKQLDECDMQVVVPEREQQPGDEENAITK